MNNKSIRQYKPGGKLQGFLGRFSVLVCVLMICSAVGQASDRPNILYIFTDDQSIRSVSAYPESHEWVHTPNIDKLANSGIRFSSCYTGAWCQPSRAAVLTGLLQHRLKTFKITRYPLCTYDPVALPFFPRVFRSHGYQTACIGKWHLGEDDGAGRDWDYSVIWDRGGPESNSHAYYENQLVRTNGGERQALGGYSTDRYTDLAVDYIRETPKKEQPWFLWLCYGAVHGPYTEAEHHIDNYSDAPETEIPVDIFGPRPTKPDFLRDRTRWEKDENGNPLRFEESVKKYHRAVAAIDEGVGRVLKALEESGQLENTLVVFTSDQGFAWGQHGCREKWLPYDANIVAPLIFSWPGKLAGGQVCHEPVNGADITRTFHSVAGIKPMWDMDGRDMSDLLKNPAGNLSSPLLMINTIHVYGDELLTVLKQHESEKLTRKDLWAWIMMREGKYKYIRYMRKDCIEELYDLEKDPDELTNLAVDSDYSTLLLQMRKQAIDEFKKGDGEFIKFLPEPVVQNSTNQVMHH
jgi:arylsulfatase A-like enzyme